MRAGCDPLPAQEGIVLPEPLFLFSHALIRCLIFPYVMDWETEVIFYLSASLRPRHWTT